MSSRIIFEIPFCWSEEAVWMFGMQKINDTSTFFQAGQSACWDTVIQTSFRPFKARLQNFSTLLISITQNRRDYWQNISLKNLSADSVSSVIAALRRMKQQSSSPASTTQVQVNIRSLPFPIRFTAEQLPLSRQPLNQNIIRDL